jgi:hypothetical protein
MVTFEAGGAIYDIAPPNGWAELPIVGALAAWIDEPSRSGFAANATVFHAPGASSRGDALADDVLPALLSDLDEPRLLDVALGAEDDLRVVVAYRAHGHHVTLFQRVLVDDTGAVTVSVTVPDLDVAATQERWRVPLQSLRRRGS